MAGGAWSSLFAGNIGVRVPQLMLASSMQRLNRIDGALPGSGYGPDFTWRMQADGGTSVGVGSNAVPITRDSFRFLVDFLPALKYSGGLIKLRMMIAEMVAGEKTTCDPAIYRFNRFTDGSEFVFRH